MLYLDTSAAVKLVRDEEGSDELADFIRAAATPCATSRVGVIELRRVTRRGGASADRSDALAASLSVIELDAMVERLAVGLDPKLRALDAIHLASALTMRTALEGFVCYDNRLATAATGAGLVVVAPGT